MACIPITTGFTFPMQVLFLGNGGIDAAKKAMRMAIEVHGWQLYKETELTMYAGGHWFLTRILLSQANNVLNVRFEPINRETIIGRIEYSGEKRGVIDFPRAAKCRILVRMDELWDALSHYAASLETSTFRFDPYLRKEDCAHNEHKFFSLSQPRRKNHPFECPVCEGKIKADFASEELMITCSHCKRYLIVPNKL
jgi:hypothetical protein